LRAGGEAFGVDRFMGVLFHVLGLFLFDQFFLVLIWLGFFQHADFLQVLLQHFTDFCYQAGDVFAALFEVAAAGVEHAMQFFNQESDVTTLAEHGGHDAGESDDPLEVVHVLGVNEYLERAAVFLRGAFVHDDVVDGDVERVFGHRGLDLVGVADQFFRAAQRLAQLQDLGSASAAFALSSSVTTL